MATGLFRWSRTPADNATTTYTWAEGMAPSSVNDSARGDKSDVAQWRDDISGAIVTGGTSTAYTVTSYQVFDTLAHMDKMMIAFTPHATNGATVTLNVDGLGAKPLRSAPSVELPAGVLILGTPYVALYNNSDAAWYLQNFYVNPYSIPIGGSLDYWGTTAPNSAFAFPYGQAISRATYSVLFGIIGTTYGAGDASTTFNLPDCRGRVIAGKDNMGGSGAGRLQAANGGLDGTVLGGADGADSRTLITDNLPPYTPSGTNAPNAAGTNPLAVANGSGFTLVSQSTLNVNVYTVANFNTLTVPFTGTPQGGLSTPVKTLQPTIIANKLLRLI